MYTNSIRREQANQSYLELRFKSLEVKMALIKYMAGDYSPALKIGHVESACSASTEANGKRCECGR